MGAGCPPPLSKAQIASAKKHYAEGDKKYKAGDFAGAETEFKAANDIKGAPQTERYIGLCEDALGHFTVAVDWYDKFLAHVPDKMATQGDEIKKREGEIQALPGKVHIDSNPPGATVTIDDKPQQRPDADRRGSAAGLARRQALGDGSPAHAEDNRRRVRLDADGLGRPRRRSPPRARPSAPGAAAEPPPPPAAPPPPRPSRAARCPRTSRAGWRSSPRASARCSAS